MARRKSRFPELTAEDAHAALRWLAATGVVKAKQITDALKKRQQMLKDIKRQLEAFGSEGVRFLRAGEPLKGLPPKRRKRPSARARAAWRAQGEYMGTTRQLSAANRAKVKAVRAKAGVRAAIQAAKKLAQQPTRSARRQQDGAQGTQPDYQTPKGRKLVAYQRRERPRPDRHGGSGAGRQQGGSGAGRERG